MLSNSEINSHIFLQFWIKKNTGQAGGKPKLDLNIEEAWELGFTGKNVTIAILDDGIDYTHPDLRNNFVNRTFINILTKNKNILKNLK